MIFPSEVSETVLLLPRAIVNVKFHAVYAAHKIQQLYINCYFLPGLRDSKYLVLVDVKIKH